MKFSTNTRNNCYEIYISGRLGFEDHAAFRDVLTNCLKSGCSEIRFQLDSLNEIDSSGLGMLLLANEMAKQNGKTVVLSHAQGQVKTLFELSDFKSQFHIV